MREQVPEAQARHPDQARLGAPPQAGQPPQDLPAERRLLVRGQQAAACSVRPAD